jgi:hypothetical protein
MGAVASCAPAASPVSGIELVYIVLLTKNGSQNFKKYYIYFDPEMRSGFSPDILFTGNAFKYSRAFGFIFPSANLQNVP